MGKYNLNTLPQDIVNQIAAGEVIERPSSVVKELIDNSIDAKATKIQIKITNGGIDLIEVSDNGVGIPHESLEGIFKPHTTSKISSLEDLNTLLTMGFRGEALSSILSVSEVSMDSKYEALDSAYSIQFKSYDSFTIKKVARESGTVISVKNLFGNIPARRKFLKTPLTEYKKIVDILYPYFLIYPNIHFTLIKDSKVVIELPKIIDSNSRSIVSERVKDVLKDDFVERMIKVFFNGNGIKISGFVAHPSDHQKRSIHQYSFVNGRPIWDSGIARGVLSAYDRYIPSGQRVPYILLIDIDPNQIDVNVHPRKEEIRFLNPFRVYASIEQAISRAVLSVTSYKGNLEEVKYSKSIFTPIEKSVGRNEYTSRDITFKDPHTSSVRDSLLFSKEALDGGYKKDDFEVNETESNGIRNMFQIFKKYIVMEFENDSLWIFDQHAAAERVTFEKLIKAGENNIDIQNLLVPVVLKYSSSDILIFRKLKEFFSQIGFKYDIEKDSIKIASVPVEFVDADLRILFDEILVYGDEDIDISKEIKKLRENILATISCHTSIRSGQILHREEMIDLYHKLIKCENPYSCPHGRPVVWKMKLSEVDSNFERTY